MSCLQCERKKQASFYNRYVGLVGYEAVTLLMSTAYFAGLRLTSRDVRVSWAPDGGVLELFSTTRPIRVQAAKGAKNVTLVYNQVVHQITSPEHAGFIIQGRPVPA